MALEHTRHATSLIQVLEHDATAAQCELGAEVPHRSTSADTSFGVQNRARDWRSDRRSLSGLGTQHGEHCALADTAFLVSDGHDHLRHANWPPLSRQAA